MFDKDKKPIRAIISYSDISDEQEKALDYNKWQKKLKDLDGDNVMLFEYNLSKDEMKNVVGRLKYLRLGSPKKTFNACVEAFLEQTVQADHRENYKRLISREALLALYYEGTKEQHIDFIGIDDKGKYRWLRLVVSLVMYPKSGDIIAYMLYEDIDEAKKTELALRERAAEDPISRALSRAAFLERAEDILRLNGKNNQHAFCFIRVNNLEEIIERVGDFRGGEVLKELVTRVKTVIQADDLVGRVGVNEFCVILRNFDFRAEIGKRVSRIVEAATRPVTDELYTLVSVGVALCPEDGDSVELLCKHAELASRFAVKSETKTDYYLPEMDETSVDEKIEAAQTIVGRDSAQSRHTLPHKRTMLIVDDSDVAREILSEMFKEDFEILLASTGAVALQLIERRASGISIIILDLMMSGVNGLDVLKRMSENAELSTIPVIVISAREETEFSALAINNGAIDFAKKPINPDIIRAKVKNSIVRSENEKVRVQNSYLTLQSDEENRYRNVLVSTGTIVFEYDWANNVFVYDSLVRERLKGDYNERSLWKILEEDGVADAKDIKRMEGLVNDVGRHYSQMGGHIDVLLVTVNGERRWFRMAVAKTLDNEQNTRKILLTFNDVHEEVISNNELKYMTEYDVTTGLYNRNGFLKHARALIEKAEPNSLVIVYFDIDHFKFINDLYGYEKGTEVLKFVASLIRDYVGEDGICARINADRFVICMKYSDNKVKGLIKTYEDAKKDERFDNMISSSFGLFIVEDKELSPDVMIDRAVIVQKKVKGNYHNIYAYYDEEVRKKLVEEQKVTRIMVDALAGGEFKFFLQPQFSLEDEAIVGAEALARWISPEHGMISPGVFIPIFEKNGFVVKLDMYLWEAVCKQLRTWLNEGKRVVPISVNISQYDISNVDVCSVLLYYVGKYEIPIEMLRLEITESAYADSPKLIIDTVNILREKGFTVEMDDFGSGYSSLNVLKDVNFDVVKLDMKFLSGGAEERKASILNAVIQMSKELKLKVVAEGVETREQADYLKRIGCDIAQGYLFAKPMPTEDYIKLLE